MRMGPGRPRRARRALALAAAVLFAAAPLAARADDDAGDQFDQSRPDELLPGQVRVIRVGDQTLLVDEVGNAILYQDPTPPQALCAELEACVTIDAPAGAEIVVPGGGRAIGVRDAASGQVLEEREAPR